MSTTRFAPRVTCAFCGNTFLGQKDIDNNFRSDWVHEDGEYYACKVQPCKQCLIKLRDDGMTEDQILAEAEARKRALREQRMQGRT